MYAKTTRRCRSRLLATCAFAFLATPALSQTYADRALQGDATVVSGTVGIVRTPVKDTITVVTPQAIVNWNPETGPGVLPPSPTPINFLPNGREALFQGAPGLADFVILNRILPSTARPVSINGTVTSQVTPFAGLPAQRGGSVWFYSPGGIIAGQTSVFNVGNLILTANDIDATGGLFSPGGAIRFRGAANSTSAVTVQPGAQVNLTRAGSYLALVAPQVAMGGTATINGSAAYVAAEQVDVTINSGLFDIVFLTGTDVANALTHTGTTTGPAAANGSIAMATMPKNTAVTLLVSGNVGYTPAATAVVQNGTVVLSAGYNLAGSAPITTPSDRPGGNVTIGNAAFTTQVTGKATDTLLASPTTSGTLSFSGNASLGAENLVSFGADSGETVTVGGTLVLSSTRSTANPTAAAGTARLYSTATTGSPLGAPVVTIGGFATVGATAIGNPSEIGQSATGGSALIDVAGGTLNLNGGLSLTANALGGDGGITGGNATAGTATFTIAGGTVTLGGIMSVTANGIGGAGLAGSSGNAIGGNASVVLNPGATPSVLTLTNFGHQISATAAVNGQFPSIDGGSATAGTASLLITSGTVSAIDLAVNAFAAGGDASTGIAGTTSAGTARVAIAGGQLDVGTLTVNADERQAASDTGTSGSTTGSGLAAVDVSGSGILNVGVTGGNSLTLSANAILGGARFGTPAIPGTLIAGTARLTSTAGGTIFTDATAPSAPKPPVLLTASVLYDQSDPALPSATQRAGTVSVIADGGTMSLHKLDMRANALVRVFPNAAGDAGPSFGGTATLAARNGGALTVRLGSGTTPVSAFGTGGTIAAPLLGTGGTINVAAQGGTLTLPDGFNADARGYAGANGAGNGGTINVRSDAGTAAQPGSLNAGAVTLDASGQLDAASPNGPAGAINISNTGAGQTMRFSDLTAFAGQQFSSGTSGSISVAGDGTTIDVTNSARFQTLGDLAITMSGLAGRLNVGANLQAGGNNITLSHLGVAPATNLTTIAANNVDMQAGNVIQQGTDFRFVGPATIRAGSVRLTARRDLGGADGAVFAAGGVELGNGRNITFRTVDANGGLSGYNDVSSTTPYVQVSGAFAIGNSVRVGTGNIDIRAGTGVDIADAGTGATGQVLLSSTTGDVRLATSGVALATRPNGITLTAQAGTVRFADLNSRASITMSGATGIVGGNAAAALGLSATSNGGGVTVGNVQATSTTLTAATNITGGSIFGQSGVNLTATNGSITATSVAVPTGPIVVNGSTGVDISAVTGSGPATLSAPNGALRIATNLAVAGTVTATGRSIFLRSLGALTFNTLNATAGNLDVASVGNLSITTPSATGTVTLASTGSNVAFGSGAAGTGFTVAAAGTATGTSANSGTGPLAITGITGITVPTLISGSTTTLSAADGAVTVATNLQSAGAVSASGQSLFLRSTGNLTANSLVSTTGNVDVTSGGALTATTVQSTVDALLGAGSTLTPGAVTAGRDIVLTAPSVTAATLAAQRDLRITAAGFARATGTLSAIRDVTINAGQTNFQTLSGRNVTITSGQGVIFTTLAATGTAALVSGDDTIGTSIVATGNVAVNAGRTINLGLVQAGGNATLYGNTTLSGVTVGTATTGGFLEARGAALNFGNVTTATDAILSSYNGALTVGDVTAGDDIFLTVNGSNANAATVSPDSQTGVVSATQFALTAGNLRSTGLGSDAATSGPRTFAGAGPTGNVIRVRASGVVQTGNITTPGTAIVASDLATIATQAISAPSGIGFYVRGNATTGDLTTNGVFWFGDSSQVFSFVPSYRVDPPGFFQTPTSGGATLGNVSASLIFGSVRDTTTFASMTAATTLNWLSQNGSIAGGTLASGAAMSVRAGGSIGFTTANAGANAFLVAQSGSITGTSLSGTTSIDASANTGIIVPTMTSNGGIALGAAAGPVRVDQNIEASTVAANGTSVFLQALGALNTGPLTATAGSITVSTGGALSTGLLSATDDIRLSTTGNFTVTTGSLSVGDDLIISAGEATTGDLTSTGAAPDAEGDGRRIEIVANRVAVGTVDTPGSILLAASQPITFVSTRSGTSTAIRSFGPITGGSSTAGTTLEIQGGSINVGNGQAGGALNYFNFNTTDTIRTGTLIGATVDASSRGTLTTGAVNATGSVNLLGDLGLTVASATSTSGAVQLLAQTSGPIASGALRAGTDLNVSAQSGTATLTTLDAGGRILMRAGGGALTFTSATAAGLFGMSATGAIGFGTVAAGDTVQIQTPGAITGSSATSSAGAPNIIQGDAGVTIGTLATNGVTVLSAINGTLNIGTDLRSTALISATGRSIFLRGTGPLTFSTLQATAGNLDVQTVGALNAGAASATGLLALTSTGGALSFTTAQSGGNATLTAATTITGTSLTSGGNVSVAASNGITIPTVVAAGAVNLAALNGEVRVATNVAGSNVSASGNGIFLRATGSLSTTRLSSNADIDVQSVGNLATDFTEARGNVTLASTNGSVSVNALGVPPADLIPANTTVTAATTATLNTVQVSGALNVASVGATTINGSAVARTISIGSSDIVIGGQARLGQLGTTTQLTLTNNSAQNRTTIGGAGTTGYSLSAAELNRIFANSIAIVAPVIGTATTAFNSARTPDVVVEGFTLTGGTNLGGEGRFSISTAGKVRVTGAALFSGMTRDNTVAIRGDEAVEILDAGSIVLNGQGTLTGTLDLTSRNIVAASTAAYADFATAPTLTAISDRAAKNDGPADDGGYLQAGGIRATLLNSTLIIQNTGISTVAGNRDFAARRGFTVGAGGFTIIQGGTNPIRIAINGRQIGATTPLGAPTAGGFVTGLDMIPLIKIQGIDAQSSDIFQVQPSGVPTAAQLAIAPRLFDTTSTVNGCTITAASACRIVPNDPIRDILLGDFGEGSTNNLLPLALIQLKEYLAPGDEPLIDEPVTGAGNDDLWSVGDAKPKCDPAKEKCPA